MTNRNNIHTERSVANFVMNRTERACYAYINGDEADINEIQHMCETGQNFYFRYALNLHDGFGSYREYEAEFVNNYDGTYTVNWID